MNFACDTQEEFDKRATITIMVIVCLVVALSPLCRAGSYEKTIYVVSVEKVVPDYGWKHIIVRYADIQPSAVTELTTHQITFSGTSHNIEPGEVYLVKYRRILFNRYPVLDEVIEMEAEGR